jgi:hypothetical protein
MRSEATGHEHQHGRFAPPLPAESMLGKASHEAPKSTSEAFMKHVLPAKVRLTDLVAAD